MYFIRTFGSGLASISFVDSQIYKVLRKGSVVIDSLLITLGRAIYGGCLDWDDIYQINGYAIWNWDLDLDQVIGKK